MAEVDNNKVKNMNNEEQEQQCASIKGHIEDAAKNYRHESAIAD